MIVNTIHDFHEFIYKCNKAWKFRQPNIIMFDNKTWKDFVEVLLFWFKEDWILLVTLTRAENSFLFFFRQEVKSVLTVFFTFSLDAFSGGWCTGNFPKPTGSQKGCFPCQKWCIHSLYYTYMVNVLKFRALYSILSKFCFFMMTLLEILSGMANSVDPDQTAPLGAVWSGSTLFTCTILSDPLV